MNKDKFVILSDIHANLTALKAVLSDIQAQGYLPDAVVILGAVSYTHLTLPTNREV